MAIQSTSSIIFINDENYNRSKIRLIFNGIVFVKIARRYVMENFGNTQFIKVEAEPMTGVQMVLSTVYEALREKGYNPVSQIVGYIMSGDPTFITSHNSARSLIMKVERDELVEEFLSSYIANKKWD